MIVVSVLLKTFASVPKNGVDLHLLGNHEPHALVEFEFQSSQEVAVGLESVFQNIADLVLLLMLASALVWMFQLDSYAELEVWRQRHELTRFQRVPAQFVLNSFPPDSLGAALLLVPGESLHQHALPGSYHDQVELLEPKHYHSE